MRHPNRVGNPYLASIRRALPDATDADVVGSPYAVSRYEVAEELAGEGCDLVLCARGGQ